ncbi:Transferase domain-containing protein [Cephalotus follicularis]|uniref:Transferase domain-containing protein n=1 Tax=Cephalotus follicularis TaxID=3775 RepID=A0A1Q3B0J1_CEPFO|nr:Transferase domain-containing protein [Cephalotus follicularis]
MNPSIVQQISECFVKPQLTTEESKQPCYLTPWDLAMLAVQYIQKGLLFKKPPATHSQQDFINTLLDKLKQSLSLTLVHFYPLAGRLATVKNENPPAYSVFVDCNNSPGAKFIHAVLDMTISDILSPTYVPLVVQSLFDHDRALNIDGHTRPLLSIQVTELVDGVFIGCSMNHSLGDGTSYWNFLNAWSEIFQAQEKGTLSISYPPIIQRWFLDGHGPMINLPLKHQEEFMNRYEAPPLKERVFHFSLESIAKVKVKANAEVNTSEISSFQSLSALVWRSITRARHLPHDQVTSCRLAINNRSRLAPPLPENYFGNCVQTVRGVTTVGQLLEHSLGWAAWKLHEAVVGHTDKEVRGFVEAWLQSPSLYQLHQFFDPQSVMMGSSPRFNMYGNEFGLGKAIALRSGYAHKFDGKVSSYPGHEGGGSIDLEVCLSPDNMTALESDVEFMNAVSSS